MPAFGKRAELDTGREPYARLINPDLADAYDVAALLFVVHSRIALHPGFPLGVAVISRCSRALTVWRGDLALLRASRVWRGDLALLRLFECGAVLAGVKAKPSGWPFVRSGPALTPAPGDAIKGSAESREGEWFVEGLGHGLV